MSFLSGFLFAIMLAIGGSIYLIKTGYFPLNSNPHLSKVEAIATDLVCGK